MQTNVEVRMEAYCLPVEGIEDYRRSPEAGRRRAGNNRWRTFRNWLWSSTDGNANRGCLATIQQVTVGRQEVENEGSLRLARLTWPGEIGLNGVGEK